MNVVAGIWTDEKGTSTGIYSISELYHLFGVIFFHRSNPVKVFFSVYKTDIKGELRALKSIRATNWRVAI
jgi:hypothetical protein